MMSSLIDGGRAYDVGMTATDYISSEPFGIGRVRVSGFESRPVPDLHDPKVVEQLLTDARRVTQNERQTRRAKISAKWRGSSGTSK
jgi:hypothetical protein